MGPSYATLTRYSKVGRAHKPMLPLSRWLPLLMAKLTRHPREIVAPGIDFEWRGDSFIHDIFRVYEVIFGRRAGVRAEATIAAYIDEGGVKRTIYQFHTFEAVLAHTEQFFRTLPSRLPKFVPVKIYMPQLMPALPGFLPSPSPYLLAVAFDAANSGFSAGAQASLTIATTVTGSNTYGVVMGSHDSGQTIALTGITWNGSAMTKSDDQGNSVSNSNSSLWGVVAPTTGNVVISVSPNRQLYGITLSYTGAKQSSQPDSHNKASDSISPYSVSTTTIADGTLVVCVARGGTLLSASTNVTQRSAPFDSIKAGDGTQATAGSFTQEWTDTVSGETELLTHGVAQTVSTVIVSVSDTLNVSEAVSRVLISLISKSDQLTVTDSLTNIFINPLYLSVSDQITVTDSAQVLVPFVVISVSDQLTVTDVRTVDASDPVKGFIIMRGQDQTLPVTLTAQEYPLGFKDQTQN